jgi:hypothetical protein
MLLLRSFRALAVRGNVTRCLQSVRIRESKPIRSVQSRGTRDAIKIQILEKSISERTPVSGY